jgi:RNA-binding protein Nova
MVSNKDAGTIIGRGGSTIATLQKISGARIKVSNANEYFPGTQVYLYVCLYSYVYMYVI